MTKTGQKGLFTGPSNLKPKIDMCRGNQEKTVDGQEKYSNQSQSPRVIWFRVKDEMNHEKAN
jgi:hypothetical protein